MLQTIIVSENEGIQRIENFLLKKFDSLSRSKVFKLLRLKEIKVNGMKINQGFKIQPGDVINVWFPKNFEINLNDKKIKNSLNIKGNLNILYEDKNLIIIDKKVGIPCQPIPSSCKASIQELLLKHMILKNNWFKDQAFTPSICNRLDTNTVGLVVAAKNGSALQELNAIFKKRHISKYYHSLVFGIFEKKINTETAYLLKDSKHKLVKINSNKLSNNYLSIVTKYHVINEFKFENVNMSLLDVELITGRTHQIRAHFSYLGHPVVGDHKYGLNNFHEENKNFKYQALHAYKIKFADLNNLNYPTLNYLSNKEFHSKEKPWFINYINSIKQ
ncbi:RluA family pseudouridine synthase [Mycoplasmoides alvi]|uniref:RluA family pseudouridine synthase n=1 Tax=Mycoplasmoides alvi TaxID=78580 RepID=UPI00051BA10E|nr:RluA family pseudouridine synthase [Mycoplasmoides alvi]